MRINDFNIVIELKTLQNVVDDAGGVTTSVITAQTKKLFANIVDLSSSNDYIQGEKQIVNGYRITVRYNPAYTITKDKIISWAGNNFNINSIKKKDIGKIQYIEMYCESTDSQYLDYVASGGGTSTVGVPATVPTGWKMLQFDFTNISLANFWCWSTADNASIIDMGDGPMTWGANTFAVKSNYTIGSDITIKFYHNNVVGSYCLWS